MWISEYQSIRLPDIRGTGISEIVHVPNLKNKIGAGSALILSLRNSGENPKRFNVKRTFFTHLQRLNATLQCHDVTLQCLNVRLQHHDVTLRSHIVNSQYHDVKPQFDDVSPQWHNVNLQYRKINRINHKLSSSCEKFTGQSNSQV